jgi:hypothetical protein
VIEHLFGIDLPGLRQWKRRVQLGGISDTNQEMQERRAVLQINFEPLVLAWAAIMEERRLRRGVRRIRQSRFWVYVRLLYDDLDSEVLKYRSCLSLT